MKKVRCLMLFAAFALCPRAYLAGSDPATQPAVLRTAVDPEQPDARSSADRTKTPEYEQGYDPAKTHRNQVLTETPKNLVIEEVIGLPGLKRPLWWLGDREFDIAKKPFAFQGEQAAADIKRLADIPRPWTVPKLLAAYQAVLNNQYWSSNEEPQPDIDARHQRCDSLLRVLAETNDIRSVITMIDGLSGFDAQLSRKALSVLQSEFGIDRDWMRGTHQLFAALDEIEKAHPLPASYFTPQTALLSYADDEWLVWTLRDRFGDRRRRAIPFRTRYFRQRIGSEKVDLVRAIRGTGSQVVANVLNDGTVILGDTEQLVWVSPGGTVDSKYLKLPGPPASSYAVTGVPNGLVVEQRFTSGATLHFLPITNGEYDIAGMMALAGDEDNRPQFGKYLKQFGDSLMWTSGGPDKEHWQLNVLDLTTRERRSTPVLEPGSLFASDGDSFVLWTSNDYQCISAKDDSTVSVLTDRHLWSERIFAVRNQIGYYLAGAGHSGRKLQWLPSPLPSPYGTRSDPAHEEERKPKILVLTAVDLSATGAGQTRELLTITVTHAWSQRQHPRFMPFAPGVVTQEELLLWHDRKWVTVPWLSSFNEEHVDIGSSSPNDN